MAATERTGLFVRIPASEAEKLDRAAFELKTPKQDLVSGLVARYVDPSPKGLASLRRTITFESADDSLVVGQHSFLPNDIPEVMKLADVAELLQADEDTVRAIAENGELPGRRIGSEWRFARSAVLDWLAGGERKE